MVNSLKTSSNIKSLRFNRRSRIFGNATFTETLDLTQYGTVALDLDASQLSTGLLSSFTDQSGNDYHWTATGSDRPTVGTTNGYQGVIFDGSNKMDAPSALYSYPTNDYGLAILVYSVANSGNHRLVQGEISGTEEFGFRVSGGDTMNSRWDGGRSVDVSDDTDIHIAVIRRTGSTHQVLFDGGHITNESENAGDVTLDYLAMGQQSSGAQSAEATVFRHILLHDSDAFTDDEVDAIANAVFSEYGKDWVDISLYVAPLENLFTSSQSAFDVTSHIDFRSNWQVSGGVLQSLNVNNNEARMDLDTPLVSGTPYAIYWEQENGTTGDVKMQLAGDSTLSNTAFDATHDFPHVQYCPSGEVAGNYTRVNAKPSGGYDADIDNIAVYDLTDVDPNTVAHDVIIVLGDSNAANATSDFVTAANTEIAFDPRIWVMPTLRVTEYFGPMDATRHVPLPCIEPAPAVEARRMSPVHAVGSRVVEWSAARGRPLMLLALGDPGSGLKGTEDWQKDSTEPTTGARMWDELEAAITALNALGPAHNIVGVVVSLGANDLSGADYSISWEPYAVDFVDDVRDLIGNPSLPFVWWNLGEHYEVADGSGLPNRGARMRTAISNLDKDSGESVAISNLVVVNPDTGNEIDSMDATNPHYNAAGMQENGRDAGDALLTLLE